MAVTVPFLNTELKFGVVVAEHLYKLSAQFKKLKLVVISVC